MDHDDYPPFVVDGNDDDWWQGQCSDCTWTSWLYDTHESAFIMATAHVYRDHGVKAWRDETKGFTWKRPTQFHPETGQPIRWTERRLLRSPPKKNDSAGKPPVRS